MKSHTHHSRLHRVVFVMVIVSLITTFASLVFVAARSSEEDVSTNSSTAATSADATLRARIADRFGRLPLSFEANHGQIDQPVKFLSRGPGYDLFLTSNEAVLSLRKPRSLEIDRSKPNSRADVQPQNAAEEVREGSVVRLKMLGANTAAKVEGRDELPGKVNYFSGSDPEKWHRNIPTYRQVYYQDVYPGIDIVYYGNQRELEYDFVVAPGADPKVIKFRIEGANKISLDEKTGSLRLSLAHGEVRLNKPFIYQHTEQGNRNEVKGNYAIKGNEISFKVRGFDSRKPLVIDPVLSYSTYLGSPGNEIAFGIAVDSLGSAYVTGNTTSNAFPTTAGAFRTTTTFGGAFVTKLDPTGSSLVYSTYLSDSTGGSTTGQAITVDAAGNAYVTGFTTSGEFPVVNPIKTSGNLFKTTDGGGSWNNRNGLIGDVRTIAIAPNALQVVYAGTPSGPYRSSDGGDTWTKLPTAGIPVFPATVALGVSPVNSAVVFAGFINGGLFRSSDGGTTWTTLTFPQSNPVVSTIVFDPVTPSTMYVGTGNGAFKGTDSGTTWAAINNFGTSFPPNVRALAIDPTAPLTIYAGTFGQGLFKSTNGGANWSPSTNGMVGFDTNFVTSVVIDPFSVATVYVGQGSSGGPGIIHKSTNSGGLWSPINTGVPSFAVSALVADRTTANTLYASTAGGGIIKTTNGGTNWTPVNAGLWNSNVVTLVAHGGNSSILFAGSTGIHSQDAFVTKLNANGSGLLFSTYLGGSATEFGNGIAVDASGNIYVAGLTTSANFPAVNAIQSASNPADNCNNGFVTKINPAVPVYVFSTYLGGARCDSVNGLAIDNAGAVYVTGSTTSSDFPVANAFQPAIGELSGDAFVSKLTATGSLAYSTYLGGDNTDNGRGIAVDASGQAYVTGTTSSSNFPTLNPIAGRNGFGDDVFVTKFNSSGSGLVYSTYIGGESSDFARGIAIDSSGNAYVVGFTVSLHFPLLPGALRTESVYFKSIDGGANYSNDNYGLTLAVNTTVNALAVHPTLPSTIYAGTGSGVFKSTNGGRTWTASNSGLLDTRVSALVIDPVTPSTLYVATNNFGSPNQGIYKSTDGGNTWNLRKNGITNTQVISLEIDPVTPNILYAGANSFGLNGQVFKTTDGAANWAPVGTPPTSSFSSIAVDPHNHTRIFGATQSSNGALFRSVDSGATWQPIGFALTGPFGNFIGVSPLTPGLLYAQAGTGLFKSVDGGDNWSLIANNSFGSIVFDPVSPSTIYSVSMNDGLLKSTDGGNTWTSLNKGLNQPLVLAFAIDPLKPSTLHVAGRSMSGDDAFVFKINAAGNALLYSTLVGGTPASQDSLSVSSQAFGIALDNAGNAYITGLTGSPVFPTTPNAYQPLLRNANDAFISKLTMSHIISGHVLDGSSAPVSGVDVVLSNGTSITQVVTETDGSYEFSRLLEGGTYTVSAAKPHFTMAPPSQTFNNLSGNQTLNFTATATNAAFHTISGTITSNGLGLAGVTVTLSGSQSGLRTTDSNGNYSFELAGGGNYTVTPALLGFTFAPLNLTFNNLSASQTANFTGTRQNFVVTNTNNHGTGSLREAITNANATVGLDTIVFNIPGPGVKIISLLNALPEITDPVVLDATTQPGYAGTPLIELDGFGLGSANGLVVVAGNSTIRGLAIGRFGNGNAITLRDGNNNLIQANHLGIDAAGNTARPNRSGILLSNSSNNQIGGTTAAARNLISGNTFEGVEVGGSNNIIQGNYIGTNAAGSGAVGNGSNGVSIQGPTFVNTLIGGTTTGAGNVISGNARGITANGAATIIQGNLIGTNAAGTFAVSNNGNGVTIGAQNVQVGGLTAGARNIISANFGNGVFFSGAGGKLEGNYIGTDITGMIALGNASTGVVAGNNVLVGGTNPAARNIIAANGAFGNVALGENSSGSAATVQGNYIGTDATGTRTLGSSRFGVTILSNDNVVGGAVAGAPNVISGHFIGIQVGGFSSGFPSGNVIQGNIIGLNAQGTAPLPNKEQGVAFTGAQNNTLGGTQTGAGNKIAFSGGPGVVVTSGSGNRIRGNSIFSNVGLGIDLSTGALGVTPNDNIDPDSGPNEFQNFPVITSVSSGANSTTIQGNLASIPNTTFQIDFYSNAAVDPSGNGEGALFFNTTSVTTNGNGDATINVTFPAALPSGRVITATATDPNGNTSEFSAADLTTASGSVQFDFNSFFVIEDVGMATIAVRRVGGSAGSLSVEYATSNGTAIAGQDYTATSGTLNFVNGETSKNIQIPILEDGPTEPDETFTLELKNASTLESLGQPSSMVITIQDRITVPFLFAENASVMEGAAGTTTEARMEVRLSAATGRTIRVNYTTTGINAFGGAACGAPGVDFENSAGQLTFQPGSFSVITPIKVCGDSSAESNEGFNFTLSNPINATIADGDGFGTIVNDDVIQLLLEDGSPIVNQAAALDALLAVRDPFRIVTVPELFANGTDRNTRVVLFVQNLQLNPGETVAAVSVRLIGSNNQLFDVIAEDFRAVPNTDFMQVVFRLPNNLPAGTCTVVVRSHTRTSNMGTIRIAP